jgi:DNA-3-methyladenine glycosylase I
MQVSKGPDGRLRCHWCVGVEEFLPYHDEEWGYPVSDDQRLFEKLCLESFQSGLSWRTILAKRENFRAAFAAFDFRKVARFGERDVQRLLADAGIVRHRGKIEAAIHNAAQAVDLVKQEGSLATYFWRFESQPGDEGQAMATALSKDLKKRGWKFFGPTTAYAFMQAAGLVNDHAADCVMHARVKQARKKFTKP